MTHSKPIRRNRYEPAPKRSGAQTFFYVVAGLAAIAFLVREVLATLWGLGVPIGR